MLWWKFAITGTAMLVSGLQNGKSEQKACVASIFDGTGEQEALHTCLSVCSTMSRWAELRIMVKWLQEQTCTLADNRLSRQVVCVFSGL